MSIFRVSAFPVSINDLETAIAFKFLGATFEIVEVITVEITDDDGRLTAGPDFATMVKIWR